MTILARKISLGLLGIFLILGLAVLAGGPIRPSMAEEIPKIEFERWVSVEPTITNAIANHPKETGVDFPDAVALAITKIKVGYPYRFKSYGLYDKLAWTADVFWKPERAAARRVFDYYDLGDFSEEDWEAARNLLKDEDSARVAIISPVGTGFIGTPVKWTEDFAEVMARALQVANAANDKKSYAVKVVASEIATTAWAASEEFALGPRSISYVTPGQSDALMAMRGAAKETIANYAKGSAYELSGLFPSTPIFIAFSKSPDPSDFKVEAKGRIITAAGATGQELGTTMPGWPYLDD